MAKGRPPVAGAAREAKSRGVVALHFIDIVVKVRRIPCDWPFPLFVVPDVGIVRNQVAKPKAPPPDIEEVGAANF